MSSKLRVTTILEPRGPAGAVVLADEDLTALGDGKKAFPVRVTVNGTTLALRVARMGEENLIGFSKAARADAGVEIGEPYTFEIQADTGERVVDVPDDVAKALDAGGVARLFAALANSHRKEFVRWIDEAKKADTRDRRIAQAVEMVRQGKTR